jgi:Icc protein
MLRGLRPHSSLNREIKKRVLLIAAVSTLVGAAAVVLGQSPGAPFGQTPAAPSTLRFVILGDRTGETVPGIYEAVWREIAAAKPDFVVGVGDSIQGPDNAGAESKWIEFDRLLEPFRTIPFFSAPGNHDVWSEASAKLFEKHTGHPLHYGFDEGPAHFTVLDNSRTDELQPGEMAFLEQDLKAHQSQPVRFIVSHRPSWLVNAIVGNAGFPLHQLAAKYGVRYVIAGHLHEMLHASVEGVDYISAPSAGGQLRASGKYEDGWFFGYIVATVSGPDVAPNITMEVRELPAPNGRGRVSALSAWGTIGLVRAK